MDYKPTGSTRRPRRANRTTDTTVIYQEDTPPEIVDILFSIKDSLLDLELQKEKLTRDQQKGKAVGNSQQAQGEK